MAYVILPPPRMLLRVLKVGSVTFSSWYQVLHIPSTA